MTDNNYFGNFPSTKSYGPHVLYIKITTSSKAMRVYAELYLLVMGALSVMGVYTLVCLNFFTFMFVACYLEFNKWSDPPPSG
jgi:hypothetical protein